MRRNSICSSYYTQNTGVIFASIEWMIYLLRSELLCLDDHWLWWVRVKETDANWSNKWCNGKEAKRNSMEPSRMCGTAAGESVVILKGKRAATGSILFSYEDRTGQRQCVMQLSLHALLTFCSHHQTHMHVSHLSHITCASNGRRTMDAMRCNGISTEIVPFDEYQT